MLLIACGGGKRKGTLENVRDSVLEGGMKIMLHAEVLPLTVALPTVPLEQLCLPVPFSSFPPWPTTIHFGTLAGAGGSLEKVTVHY